MKRKIRKPRPKPRKPMNHKGAKHHGGRPRWELEPGMVKAAYEASRNGLVKDDIARAALHCSPKTMYDFLKKNPEGDLAQAIKDGRSEGVAKVAGKLYAAAIGDGPKWITAAIFYLKTVGQFREKVEVSGDPKRPIMEPVVINFTAEERERMGRLIAQAVTKAPPQEP